MTVQRTHGSVNGNNEGKVEIGIASKSNRWAGGRQYRFIYDIDLPFTQKSMLHAIASYLETDKYILFSDKTAYPGYEALVKLTGMSNSGVRKIVDELWKAGFIYKENQFSPTGKQSSNRYRVNPALPAFYDYRDLMKRSRKAPVRELSSIDDRFQAISSEIVLALRLDEISVEQLAIEKPGLFEGRVKHWLKAEKLRGVDWAAMSGQQPIDDSDQSDEPILPMNSSEPPHSTLRVPPHSTLRVPPHSTLRVPPHSTKETSNEVTDYEPPIDWSGWRSAQRPASHERN